MTKSSRLVAVFAILLVGCSAQGGRDAFCDDLAGIRELIGVSILEQADPEEYFADTRKLLMSAETHAPTDVRGRVADLQRAMDVTEERWRAGKLQYRPGERPSETAEESAAFAARDVALQELDAYARAECGIELLPGRV